MAKRLMWLMVIGLGLMFSGIVKAEEEFGVDISETQVILQAGEETFTVSRFGRYRLIKAGVCTIECAGANPIAPAPSVQRKVKLVVDGEKRKVVEVICPLDVDAGANKERKIFSDRDIRISLEIRKGLPYLFINLETRNLTEDTLSLIIRCLLRPPRGFAGRVYCNGLDLGKQKDTRIGTRPWHFYLPEGMNGLGIISEGNFRAGGKIVRFPDIIGQIKAGGSVRRTLILIPAESRQEMGTIYEKNKETFTAFLITGIAESTAAIAANSPAFTPPADSNWIKIGKKIESHGLEFAGNSWKATIPLTISGRECRQSPESWTREHFIFKIDRTKFDKEYKGRWVAVGVDYFDRGRNCAFRFFWRTTKEKEMYPDELFLERQRKYLLDGTFERKCLLEDTRQWKRKVFIVNEPIDNRFSFAVVWPNGSGKIILAQVFAKPLPDKEAMLYIKSRQMITDNYNELMVSEGKVVDKLMLARRARFYLERMDKSQAEEYRPDIEKFTYHLENLQFNLKDFQKDYDEVFFEEAEKLFQGEKDEVKRLCLRVEKKAEALASKFQEISEEISSYTAQITRSINSRYAWFSNMRFKTQPAVIFQKEGMIRLKDMAEHIIMGSQACDSLVTYIPESLKFDVVMQPAMNIRGYPWVYGPFPEPGKFNFPTDSMLKAARECGWRFSFYYPPQRLARFKPDHWFVKKYEKSGAFIPKEDGSLIHRGWYIGSIHHPAVRKLIMDWLDAFGRHLKDEAYFFHYILSDEGGYRDTRGGEAATKAFRNYLKKKFETIDSVNKTLGVNYVDFSKIEPEKIKDQRALKYQWERFNRDSYAEFLKECKDTLEKADPNHPARDFRGPYFGSYLRTCADLFNTWIKVGWKLGDMHDCGVSSNYANTGYSLYRYIKMKDKRAILSNSEYYWHSPEGRGGAGEKTLKGVLQRNLWTHFLWGKRVWGFYHLHGPGGDLGWLLEPRYEDKIVRYSASRIPMMKEKLEKFSKIQWESEVKTDVAMLISATSDLLLPVDKIQREIRYLREVLFAAHLPFFYIPEIGILNGMEDLSQYKVIVIPYEPYFRPGLSDKLLKWVKKGGVLITSGPPGVYNQYLKKDGEILKKVFGIEEIEEKAFSSEIGDFQGFLSGNQPIKIGSSYRITKMKDKKEVEILARFSDKTPAVLSGFYGKGKVYLSIVSLPKSPILSRFMIQAAEEAIPVKYATCDKGRVELVIREGTRSLISWLPIDKRRYLFAINHNPNQPIKTTVKIRGEYKKVVDLDTGCAVKCRTLAGVTKFKISLQPGGGTVFRLAK